jgi:sulfite reductase (NADPH) hemoprotein beta-component
MSIAAVGRITYLTSEVVINSQPAPPDPSVFAEAFVNAARVSVHKPKVISSPSGADDAQTILRNASNLTTLTTLANPQRLTRLLPHLGEIAASAVVIHVAVHDDLSDVLLLRSSVPFFLLSTTAQKAHDNALLAARLARVERKAVIHAFYVSASASPFEALAEEQIHAFCLSAKPSAPSQINGQGENHSDPSTDLLRAYQDAALRTSSLIKRPLGALVSQGPAEPQTVMLILGKDDFVSDVEGVLFISISLITPLPQSLLLNAIPQSAKLVIVLEQIYKWYSKWTPLYLDTVAALQERTAKGGLLVQSGELGNSEGIKKVDIEALVRTSTSSPTSRVRIGGPPVLTATPHSLPQVPKHEASYTKILSQLFQERLEISNAPELAVTLGESATTPEFALGRVRGQLESRTELVNSVQELLQESEIDSELHSLLTKWVLAKEDPVKSKTLGNAVIESLNSASLKTQPFSRYCPLAISFHPVRGGLSAQTLGRMTWARQVCTTSSHLV